MARKKSWRDDYRARWRAAHPWVRYLEYARRRCKDIPSKWFQYYGSRGITCELTLADVAILWKRDHAAKLKKPSLDRIDGEKNYSLNNCRFIEFKDNARMAWDETFKFLYNGDDSAERDCLTDHGV